MPGLAFRAGVFTALAGGGATRDREHERESRVGDVELVAKRIFSYRLVQKRPVRSAHGAASAWTKFGSQVSRACGTFLLRMRRITAPTCVSQLRTTLTELVSCIIRAASDESLCWRLILNRVNQRAGGKRLLQICTAASIYCFCLIRFNVYPSHQNDILKTAGSRQLFA